MSLLVMQSMSLVPFDEKDEHRIAGRFRID
jgi:hypothetical protein